MKKKAGITIARADVLQDSVNLDKREFTVVFATETPVYRSPYWSDESFYEVLVCNKDAIRSERLDGGVVPLIDTHDTWSITGQYGIVKSWSIDNGECRAVIQFSEAESKAEVLKDIAAGVIRSISVGAKIYQYERVPNKDPKETPTYRAVDWEPHEISLAAVPADPKASVRSNSAPEFEVEILNYTSNRSVMTPTPEQIEAQRQEAVKAERKRVKDIRDAVRAAGLEETFADNLIERGVTISEANTAITERRNTPTPEDALKAERKRAKEIRDIVRKFELEEDFADDMIERGITLDAARAEVMDKLANKDEGPKSGSSGGSVGADRAAEMRMDAMIDGMMQRADPGSVSRYYDVVKRAEEQNIFQIEERGHVARKAYEEKNREYMNTVRQFQQMRFIDIARAVLVANNVPNAAHMPAQEVAKRAMDTTDLPDLFTTTVKRFLRMNYETFVPEWLPYSRQVPADDFRVKTGVKVDSDVTFEELTEDNEYKESTLMSDEKATIQLKTYARKISISRKTIINDDLGALTIAPKAIGIGARKFQSKKFWGMITGNVACPDGNPLFHAKHGNLGSGAKAGLIGDSTLSEARKSMMRQKSPMGNELDISPKYLMVPPELLTPAQKQIRPINATQTADTNIWGDLMPVNNVYFTNEQEWYLVADPKTTMVDGAVHAYLQGQEGLYTESYIDKDTDKMVIKARLDFDCAMWGWQGWYKNNGSAPVAD